MDLEGHVEIDRCHVVYQQTPILPTPASAQGRPMEPTTVHRIQSQPTISVESNTQDQPLAKRIAVFLNLIPEGEFKTLVADHDVTVVSYTGFGAANTAVSTLGAVRRRSGSRRFTFASP